MRDLLFATKSSKLRFGASLSALFLVVASCSTDVTQSEEYLALEGEKTSVEEARAEAETRAESAEGEVDSLRQELADAEERASTAEATVAELEADLAEERNRIEPYPPAVVDLFVEGCAEGDPSILTTCECAIDQVQGVIPLGDFFEISVAFAELELDPETGEPPEEFFQIEGARPFFEAFFDCLFA